MHGLGVSFIVRPRPTRRWTLDFEDFFFVNDTRDAVRPRPRRAPARGQAPTTPTPRPPLTPAPPSRAR
jgi:hypothetical protein